MRPSRREFVKWLSAGGISVSLSHLAAAANAPFAAHETLPGRGNFNPATKGSGRVDGVAKVTGAKLYASDFRANDMPGWPQTTSHAILVRANDATHVYTGMDLARLSGPLKPSVVVTASDLDRIGTQVPEFYAGDLFCPLGKTPLYLGQPVALLIFEKFDAFDQARLALRDGTFVRFGEETGPVIAPDYGSYRFTRVAGAIARQARHLFADPGRLGLAEEGAERSTSGVVAARQGDAGRLRQGGQAWRADPRRACRGQCLSSRARPRVRDPIGRSDVPGAGMRARLVRAARAAISSWCSACSRPMRPRKSLAHLLGKAHAPFKPSHINAQFAYVGGGFGGRDHTPFILYVALAAMFFPGKPVRLAHDRYQQFQGGIKRHPIKMRSRIGIDRATGLIKAFAADHVLDGGGLAELLDQRRGRRRHRRDRHL